MKITALVALCSLSLPLAGAFPQSTLAHPALIADPIFEKNCAKCHGKAAAGRHFGGPSLVSEKITTVSADDLRGIITAGKGRMPKFGQKLTPEQIDALVQEIQAATAK